MQKGKFKAVIKGRKVTALFIAVVLAVLIIVPPSSRAAVPKEEVVYVRLNNDGSVDRVYVVNSFELGEGNEILDYGNYAYVKNLSDDSVLKLVDGKVTVSAKGDRLYYEGFLIDPQLPWNISITYFLDGQEIPPEKLAGKSGHLVIRIETSANPLGSREFFDTYALQVSVTLKSGLCKNIKATGGTLAINGSNRQANYVLVPGKPAAIELAADVENFEMPAITIAGLRLNMDFDFDDADMSEIEKLADGIAQLDDGVQELLDGIFDLNSGVSDLHEGTVELADGVGEFRDGVSELVKGTGELKDGVSELKDGTVKMADGATELADGTSQLVDGARSLADGMEQFADGIDELYDGVGQLYDGAQELGAGMEEIAGGAEELTDGAYSLAAGINTAADGGRELQGGFELYFDAILELVNQQLAGTGIPRLSRDNYAAVLENALFGGAIQKARETIRQQVYGAARQSVLEAVLAGSPLTMEDYEALPGDDPVRQAIDQAVAQQLEGMEEQLDAQVESLLNDMMTDILEGAANSPEGQKLLGLLELLKGYEQLLTGLSRYVSGVHEISNGAWDLAAGVSDLNEGLKQYRDGILEYTDGMAAFYENAGRLVDGAHELKDGTWELLDGIIKLRDGTVEFRDGTLELRDGVIELLDGVVELHNGVIEMHDGTVELHDGVLQLASGTGELLEGTTELHDGVSRLKEGTGELREKTANLKGDIIGAIKDKFSDLLGKDKPVYSFVSERNGQISAVQFVMQTEGISIPEDKPEVTEPAEKLGFWQRFLRLFAFLQGKNRV